MQPSPRVSVILPTFNRHTYLAEAITSVLAQRAPPLDIVVVDDGSTDSTPDICAQFAHDITYVRQENAGKLAAIATGLDRTSGDLVWIMDDDDIAAPDALQNLVAPFMQNPELVLSYGRMTRFDDDNPQAPDQLVEYPDDPRPFLVRMMEDCFVTGHPCVLVRRDALQGLRPFDRAVIASVDYYLHLGVAQKGPTAFVDTVVLRQRQHSGLRGPKRSRYGEADRNAKWVLHDAYLLKKMLADLPLDAYLSAPPWTAGQPLAPAAQRRALIQKAVIAGRKKLWPDATAALHMAMQMLPDTPLSADELRVLSGMLGCRYGINEVYEMPEILTGLHSACAIRQDQSTVLTALSRPLLHEIKIARREHDLSRAARTVRCWSQLMDIRATWVALQSALGRNFTRAAAKMRLS